VSVANAVAGGGPPRYAQFVSTIQLSACKLAGVAEVALCGVLEVPENPSRPTGRRLGIGIAVIPATGPHPRTDPIAVLTGGPGEDAIGAAGIYATRLAPLRQDRDILLVDQRGTGRSGQLLSFFLNL
jgi:pimeloyl-ACP methyl ester carboxylesterase